MTVPAKTILITGASQGIGFAAASLLARQGHRVAIAGRSTTHLETAAEKLRALGVPEDHLLLLEMEVGAEDSMQASLNRLQEHWGEVDILINNAGLIAPPEDFGSRNIATLRAALEVNLFAVAYLCEVLLPAMRQRRWGRIVNVASTAGLGAPLRLMPYSVSKAALIALTKSLAVDVAEQGICVNAVAPGPVATDNYRAAKGEAAIAARARSIPSGRLAEPQDVAEVIAFLASPGAAHLTGQVIAIDGGEYAAGLYTAQWVQARSR